MSTKSGGAAARASNQATRRTTSATQGVTTRGSAIRDQSPKIQTAEEARTWLCDSGAMVEANDPIDVDTIKAATLLLLGMKDIPGEAKEGLRAIAIGLEELRAGETERAVLETVEKVMEGYREVLENLAEATVKTVKEMAEQTKETFGRIEEGQIVEGRAGTGEEGGEVRTAAPGGRLSFAEVARRAEHEDVVRRTKNKTKQMLIDNEEGSDAWKALSEKELVERARLAKELMGIQGLDSPQVVFLSARKLRNGGVLYELNSTEAALWLAKADVRAAFLEKFGAGARVKDRTFDIFVEFVPVTLGDAPVERLTAIEAVNDIPPGGLVSARWAKAPHTRRTNQRVAHLVLACATDTGANNLIRNGMVIEGKRVIARKLDMEPRRCLKCQKLGKGHLASECRQDGNTCGLCAKDHRTSECKETDSKEYSCVNCKARGLRHDHPSSARSCPTFMEAKERLLSRSPELAYRYYVTDQPWTWMRTEGTDSGEWERQTRRGAGREGETTGGVGQGGPAGGGSGQGGGFQGTAGGREQAATAARGPRTGGQGPRAEAQTTLDEYRWRSTPEGTQANGRTQSQGQGAYDWDKEMETLLSDLEALKGKARQLSQQPEV